MAAWEIIPYRTSGGRSPVEDFIDDLSAFETSRIEVALDLLAEFGPSLGMPHVRPMGHNIWELRIRGKNQHRILYVTLQGRNILLLHAFTKKTQRTPARAITLARDRLVDFRRRNEGT